MTTIRTRSESSSAGLTRRLSHVPIPESTGNRSNSTDDASGSCTDIEIGL